MKFSISSLNNKNYLSMIIWIAFLLFVGSVMGALTKSDIDSWYIHLSRSSLTPPNYIFPIAWTILYIMIAISGWMIWQSKIVSELRTLKIIYILQLMLNWSWTPLFFYYHLTGISFFILLMLDIAVIMIIYLTHRKIRLVSLLMFPYLMWILFASYLNYFIWQNN